VGEGKRGPRRICADQGKEKGPPSETPLSAPESAADIPNEPEAASNTMYLGAKH